MKLSYRARRRLGRLGRALAVLALIAVLVWLCWVVWLERYVIYTDQGAKLDFDRPLDVTAGQAAVPPAEMATVPIYFNEGDQTVDTDNELKQLTGVWADTNTILDGLGPIRTAVAELEPGSAVLLDLKSKFGNFYYSTSLGDTATSVDVSAVTQLISELAGSDVYLIARVPAFRDRNYGLAHTTYGLPTKRGYLWEDSERCYWLDPANSNVMSYLMNIATELRMLGFDEVVFSEFRIPEDSSIVYAGDRTEVLAAAASNLELSCATDDFAVSFQSDDPLFPLPAGRSRLYLEGIDGAMAAAAAAERDLEDAQIRLVFLTQTNDTRYNDYGALRPVITNYTE